MLSVVQKVFFGPLDNPKNHKLSDINLRETLAVAPLVATVFVLGLFPNLVLSRMQEGVSVVLDRYEEGRRAYAGMEEGSAALLRGRRGGPLDRGYPEPPDASSDSKSETALNTEGTE
jgi:NADH-quinone oxidoreductase subunit M